MIRTRAGAVLLVMDNQTDRSDSPSSTREASSRLLQLDALHARATALCADLGSLIDGLRAAADAAHPTPAHLDLGPELSIAPVDQRDVVLVMDADTHTASVQGRRAVLTRTEWRLLAALADLGGRPATKDELAALAWGEAFRGRTAQVEIYVSRIRKKLGETARNSLTIITEPNGTYRCGRRRVSP